MPDDEPLNSRLNPKGIVFTIIKSETHFPPGTSVDSLAQFLHTQMVPYEDKLPDVDRGLRYALSSQPGEGGFVVLATDNNEIAGATVFLETGMRGYVPENLLLFVCVHADLRGNSIGEQLIARALEQCKGAVKLHVEPENPARRLYERVGFKTKYLEMRYQP